MRGEIIYLSVYLLTEFLNYLLAYAIIFQARITKNIKKWIGTVAIIFLLHNLLLYYVNMDAALGVSVFSMIVIPLFLLEKIEKKNILIYPFVVIGTSTITISATFMVGLLIDIPEYLVVDSYFWSTLCQCIPICIFLLFYLYLRRKGSRSIQLQLGVSQYVLFYVGTLSIFFMLSSMQLITQGDISRSNINDCGVAISVASITLVLLIIWQGVVVNREMQIKQQARIYEQYMELQEEYFRQIIERDEKMRRLHHDMNAHMTALKAYCNEGNNAELDSYLDAVIKDSAVYDTKSYTGNKGVDAILRQLEEEAEEKDIHLEIRGILPVNTEVTVYDLCTIFSNLLKNAIEACERIEKKEDRNIFVDIHSYNDQIILSVKNKVNEKVNIVNNQLPTTKADNTYHGIGSQNVQATVQKYKGEWIYSCEEDWFLVEIIL